MRVKIGPYRHRWTSELHTNYMNRKYGRVEWDGENRTKFEELLEKVEDAFQWVYNATINKILDKRSYQRVHVKINKWDTWSMDHTLSYIIVPMLKQLQETKHGSPWVDDEDVPENIRSTSAPKLTKREIETGHLDEFHHDRWEWVLNEMIWAFEQKTRDDWEGDYYKYEHFEPNKESKDWSEQIGMKLIWEDREGREAHQKRMSNGFKLFGKYYECLWD